MTLEEAKKYAENMSYEEAINNCLHGKSVPHKKATKIKLTELLKSWKISYSKGKSEGYSKAENDYYKRTEKDREECFEIGFEIGKQVALKECYEKFYYNSDAALKWLIDQVENKSVYSDISKLMDLAVREFRKNK